MSTRLAGNQAMLHVRRIDFAANARGRMGGLFWVQANQLAALKCYCARVIDGVNLHFEGQFIREAFS